VIAQSDDIAPAELARRVAAASQAREVLRNGRPTLLQHAAAFAWYVVCGVAMGKMAGPLFVKTVLFCAVTQVPTIFIFASIQRRRLDAVIELLQQSQSGNR
jgi:hypothetical protein